MTEAQKAALTEEEQKNLAAMEAHKKAIRDRIEESHKRREAARRSNTVTTNEVIRHDLNSGAPAIPVQLPPVSAISPPIVTFDGHRFCLAGDAGFLVLIHIIQRARHGDALAVEFLNAFRVEIKDMDCKSYWPPA